MMIMEVMGCYVGWIVLHAGVQGDLFSVVVYNFYDYYLIVVFSCCFQSVQCFYGYVDGGVKAKGIGGGFQVVVYGFGHVDNLDALLGQVVSDFECVVVVDDDQTVYGVLGYALQVMIAHVVIGYAVVGCFYGIVEGVVLI